ncbi:hypothetical protein QC762_0037160 [Podospora pseudocomata]|uniref:Uncharacterized protein n=1 Tax=Podospora pseudocomata TaxID=2093779 RepID=A0ABR0GLH3_9PEZI|nr:hypothetical protein QC762_0037160 [Podospora pseudocomata]
MVELPPSYLSNSPRQLLASSSPAAERLPAAQGSPPRLTYPAVRGVGVTGHRQERKQAPTHVDSFKLFDATVIAHDRTQ